MRRHMRQHSADLDQATRSSLAALRARVVIALGAAVLLAGCTRTINLLDPAAPRFSGDYALLAADSTYTNLAVVAPDGDLVCSALPTGGRTGP